LKQGLTNAHWSNLAPTLLQPCSNLAPTLPLLLLI
jgi:hypothetical protein